MALCLVHSEEMLRRSNLSEISMDERRREKYQFDFFF